MKIYIGWDPAEELAFRVAVQSLRRHAHGNVDVTALRAEQLRAQGLLTRPVDARGGQYYDLVSQAPAATQFAVSRFLVPLLAQEGWALFTDCDVVFTGNVHEIMDYADGRCAVQVVKHAYTPHTTHKMQGKTQTQYSCKNWSSVMLFNCSHPANRRLTLDAINTRTGLDLHQFFWLADQEIGVLPEGWNWLVDERPRPPQLWVAHYTLGGPWLPGWSPRPSDSLWHEEASRT